MLVIEHFVTKGITGGPNGEQNRQVRISLLLLVAFLPMHLLEVRCQQELRRWQAEEEKEFGYITGGGARSAGPGAALPFS